MEHAGVEIDMDSVQVPLSRARAVGLQHELRDHLAAEDFQERLCACERSHPQGSLDFRRAHQVLVLEVQAKVLPKYGFEGTLQGVHDMLEAFEAFKEDSEITANIREINHLIWKPNKNHGEHHDTPAHDAQKLAWRDQWQHILTEHPPVAAPAKAPVPPDHSTRNVGVELDLSAVQVPLTKQRLLGLQEELRDRLATPNFQARLRECEAAHDQHSADFRKEHQQLVLREQAEVLPKYGFPGTMQGVHDLLATIKSDFKEDPEVGENLRAIDALIWKEGCHP